MLTKKHIGTCLILIFIVSSSFIKPNLDKGVLTKALNFPFTSNNTLWADSILETLTPDERIAQLFMVAAYSNKDSNHVNKIKKLISDYKIGGLIFMQGGPNREAILANEYQNLSKVPMMLSIDGEWGLAMRLDSTVKYLKIACRKTKIFY